MQKPSPPAGRTEKILYHLWNNLPRLVLLLMILLIAGLAVAIINEKAALTAAKEKEIKEEKPPVNVVVLQLQPTTITDRINLPGTIFPWTDLTLQAKVGGTVKEIAAREGMRVAAGEPLVLLEDDDYRIAVARTQAAYALAESEYKRDKSIFDKGVIAAATLEAKKTSMQTARADYENARLQLSRTRITTPMAGVINTMIAEIGLRIGAGDPVARILQTDKMKAVIGIPESDIAAVRKIDQVELLIQALGDKKVIGDKYFLSSAPETTARIYNLELEIDNSQGDILAGMFVRADIVKQQWHDALALPFYSVITREGEQFVFIEKNGVAMRRDVTLGVMEGWKVQITSGLQPGDKVLVEGHRDVEEGQKINIIKSLNQDDTIEGILR